jgi:hypothetical protein
MMKHSTRLLATRATLRILIVLNWIFGALIFALLAISFLAEEWTWRALGVGAVGGHERVIAGMRAVMVIGIVGTPIAYVVFTRLLRILESVRTGEPFTMDNAGRLRRRDCLRGLDQRSAAAHQRQFPDHRLARHPPTVRARAGIC